MTLLGAESLSGSVLFAFYILSCFIWSDPVLPSWYDDFIASHILKHYCFAVENEKHHWSISYSKWTSDSCMRLEIYDPGLTQHSNCKDDNHLKLSSIYSSAIILQKFELPLNTGLRKLAWQGMVWGAIEFYILLTSAVDFPWCCSWPALWCRWESQ